MKKHLLVMCAVLCLATTWASAQRTLRGTITDGQTGEPLIGASVLVEGTSTGTVTDFDGQFTLDVPQGAERLVISYTGYATQELDIGSSDVIDVDMETSAAMLQDVVVTAMGFETEKGKIGVASSTVEGDALLRSGETGLINSLAGKSAGVNITQSSGDPGASSRIQIRGATSITGNLEPLIVVDGVPMFNDSYYGEGFGGQVAGSGGSIGSGGGVTQQSRLNDLNPEDIESVEILRGASAAAIWGSRAANGVMVITTKKGSYNPGKKWTLDLNGSIAFDQVNKKIPLNETYGQGISSMYTFVPPGGLSWGDKIANRPGGTDAFITDPSDPDYQGKFVADSGNEYYALLDGTPDNPSGGKNSRTLYDPYDLLFKTGVTYSTSLGLSTGGENGTVYISLGTLQQDGMIKTNSNYKRNTVRLNATRNLGNIVSVAISSAYTNTNSDRVQMGSNLNGLFLGGLRSAVDFNDADYQGTYTDPQGSEFFNRHRAYRNPLGINDNSIYDNPIWMMNNIQSTTRVDRFISKVEVRVDPLKWLSFTARGGLDTYTDEREDFYPVLSSGTNNGGRYTKETITRRQLNLDLIARARFDITQNFKLSALVGTGINERRLRTHGSTTRSFLNEFSPPNVTNGTNQELFNDGEIVRLSGIYGSFGLELFDQLFVNGTARNDWISTLPEANRSFFYPAFDVAWQFTKILPQNNILSSGKLRGGWGQVGRGPDAYNTIQSFYTPTAANTGFGEGWGPGINPQAYGGAFALSNVAANPNLKPETKTEWEAGVDLGFWNDRLTTSFTYYQNVTTDLIIQIDPPESSGFAGQLVNGAEIKNEGVELEWNLGILRTSGGLNLDIYGNFTRNRNEVTNMAGVESILLSGFSGTSSRAVVGEQLGALWGAKWARDDAGNLALDDAGFPTLAPTPGVIGDPNPDFRAGYGALVTIGGFSANILFDMAYGMEIWNGTKGALAFFGRAGYTTAETTLTAQQANNLNIYTGQTVADYYSGIDGVDNGDGTFTVRGQITDFGGGEVFLDETWYYVGPGSGFTGPDEQFVEDASWARLRELTLSYSFGRHLNNVNWIQNATLSLTGRNLFLWTDYDGNDPDTNLVGPGNNGLGLDYFQNPSSRTYKVALNLTF